MKKPIQYLLIVICTCFAMHSLIHGMFTKPASTAQMKHFQTSRSTQLVPHAQNAIKKQCNNLILILDENKWEKKDAEQYAMTMELVIALTEKAAPVIISNNIVENFCHFKTKYMFGIIPPIASDMNFIKAVNIVRFVTISDKDWIAFAHPHANLILLIPKNYITSHAQASTTNIADQAAQCGFDTTNLTHIPDLSLKTLINYLQNHVIETPIAMSNALQSMLIKKNDPRAATTLGWNIFLTGHGGPATKRMDNEYYKILTEQAQMRKKISNTHREYMALMQDTAQTEKQQTYKELLESLYEQDLDLMLKKERLAKRFFTEKATWNLEQSNIAGISYANFKQLMKICNTDIKTLFLHYSTCFSGGYNQPLINEMLQELNVDFIVSAQGIGESVTYGWNPDSGNSFTQFFALLEAFFADKISSNNLQKTVTALEKDPIAAIIKNVIEINYINSTQPFVRIPAAGVFNALTVDKKVKIVTNSIAKAHEFENKPINLTDPQIEIVFVYPHNIQVPVLMNEHVSVISPTPHTITTTDHHSVHIFDQIISDGSWASLMSRFIWLNSSYATITFVIKKLTCLNKHTSWLPWRQFTLDNTQPTDIENVIIQLKGQRNQTSWDTDSTVDILFTFNNKDYAYSKTIESMSKKRLAFWNIFHNALPTVATSETLNAAAVKIANLEGSISEHQATIPMIVEELEKKTDKTFNVQEPGALQKILLKTFNDQQNTSAKPEKNLYKPRFIEPGVAISTPTIIKPQFIPRPFAQ